MSPKDGYLQIEHLNSASDFSVIARVRTTVKRLQALTTKQRIGVGLAAALVVTVISCSIIIPRWEIFQDKLWSYIHIDLLGPRLLVFLLCLQQLQLLILPPPLLLLLLLKPHSLQEQIQQIRLWLHLLQKTVEVGGLNFSRNATNTRTKRENGRMQRASVGAKTPC